MTRAFLPLLLLFATLAPASALAQQQPSATLDRFDASELVNDDFHLSRPGDFGHLRLSAVLHLDYAFNPLVFETALGDASSEDLRIVEDHLVGTVGLALGLFDRLVVFAGLPVTLAMDGAPADQTVPRGLATADSPGLGDLDLGARVRIVGEDDDIGALGFQLTATLPTGAYEEQFYRSEDHVTIVPEVVGELRPGYGSRVVLNLGARFRNEDPLAETNLEYRHELTFGVGFAIPVWTDEDPLTHLDLHAQLYGSTAFARAFQREQTPLEATLGAKLFHRSGFVVGLAGGPGLARGIGSPDLRLVLMLGYAPPVGPAVQPVDQCPGEAEDEDGFQDDDGCADPDNDGDGILDSSDRCPMEPENFNGLDDEDGCPDELSPGDRDGDGIPDADDDCVDEPEDRDDFQDDDGCPDPDNDEDGVLDVEDRCIMVPGLVDNEGCPEPDRDGDGVVDRLDNCPDEPGSAENNGCEDAQQVTIRDGQLEIIDRVYFRTNRDVIQSRSFPLLRNVASVLNAHPEIESVVVEGHTDARGNHDRNVALSQRRARAVVTFLVRAGVSRGRLSAVGYGPDRPILPEASTPEEHAQNRRVEFRIPDGAGIQQQNSAAGADTIDR